MSIYDKFRIIFSYNSSSIIVTSLSIYYRFADSVMSDDVRNSTQVSKDLDRLSTIFGNQITSKLSRCDETKKKKKRKDL